MSTYKPPYATDTLSVGTYNIGKVSPIALQDEARKAPQAVQEQSQPAVQYNLSPPNEYPYVNDGDTYYTSAPTSVGKELTHSITHRGDRYYRSKLFGDTPNYVYLANQNSASTYLPEDQDAYLASFREKRPISLGGESYFAGFNSISPFTHKEETDCLALSKIILHNYGLDGYGLSSNVFKLMEELWIGEGRTDNDRVLRNYDDGITSIAQNYRNAINCLDEHLEAKRPIIVGVSHSKPRRDENGKLDLANEGATDHFIVVNGRGFDEVLGLPYYTYYEVGTSTSFGYNMEENRLVYDPINLTFYDLKSKSDKRYDVTQVRPNNKNLEGTISQGERK